MPAKPGDEGVWQNMPVKVIQTKTVGSQQFDTIVVENPQIRVVPDSQVTVSTDTPPAPSPSPAPPAPPPAPARPVPHHP